MECYVLLLGSLLIWLGLGIFYTGYLPFQQYALLGLVGRRIALFVAFFFIVVGGVRFRDER